MTTPATPVTGCDALEFEPTFNVEPDRVGGACRPTSPPASRSTSTSRRPTTRPTSTPSSTPRCRRRREPKDITVKLPAGLSISPSSADGLGGCSDHAADPAGDQVHYDNTKPVTCPRRLEDRHRDRRPRRCWPPATRSPTRSPAPNRSPATSTCSSPTPATSPSGDQDGKFRLLIQLEKPRYGVNFKLPGIATADKQHRPADRDLHRKPAAARSSTCTVNFKPGPRAPLATPVTCGTFTTTSDLVPWSTPGTPDAHPSAELHGHLGPERQRPAPPRRRPAPSARRSAPAPKPAPPGQSSPFILHLTRNDGEQELSSLDVTLPKGFTAKLTGIPYCSEAAIAAATGRSGAAEQANPSCPAASQDRHASPPAPAPAPTPSTSPATPTSPAPTKAPRSRAWSSSPRRSPAPSTSATSSSGPPLFVDPRNRPGHGQLRPDPADPRRRPAADPLDRGPHRPPRLHPQPDQLRSRRRSTRPSAGSSGASATLVQPLPGRRLRRARLQPEARAQPQGRDQAQRPPGAEARSSPTPGRLRQHRLARRSPCRTRSSSTTPTSTRSAPGSSSPPTHARPDRSTATPRRPRRCSTRPSKGRSTCAAPPTSCPTWSPTCTARSTSPSPGASTPPRAAASAPPSKRSPTPRSPIRPRTGGRQEGPAGKLQEPLRQDVQGDCSVQRPERPHLEAETGAHRRLR